MFHVLWSPAKTLGIISLEAHLTWWMDDSRSNIMAPFPVLIPHFNSGKEATPFSGVLKDKSIGHKQNRCSM